MVHIEDKKLLYTVKETAFVLGCNIHIVYDLINSGLLPAMKLGSLKVRVATLEEFLEKYDGMDLSDLNNITNLKTE